MLLRVACLFFSNVINLVVQFLICFIMWLACAAVSKLAVVLRLNSIVIVG